MCLLVMKFKQVQKFDFSRMCTHSLCLLVAKIPKMEAFLSENFYRYFKAFSENQAYIKKSNHIMYFKILLKRRTSIMQKKKTFRTY